MNEPKSEFFSLLRTINSQLSIKYSLAQQSRQPRSFSDLKAALTRNFRVGVIPDVCQTHIRTQFSEDSTSTLLSAYARSVPSNDFRSSHLMAVVSDLWSPYNRFEHESGGENAWETSGKLAVDHLQYGCPYRKKRKKKNRLLAPISGLSLL